MRTPATLAAVPLLLGAAVGILFVDSTPEYFVCAAIAGASLALLAGCGFCADRLPWAVGASVIVGFSLTGYSVATCVTRDLYAPSIVEWFDAARDSRSGDDLEPVVIEGILREDAAITEFGALLHINVHRIVWDKRVRDVHGGIRVTVSGSVPPQGVLTWRAGRGVRMPVLLRRPVAFRNPGASDETRALARRGVALLGTVKSSVLAEVTSKGSRLDELAAVVRAWVREVIGVHVAPHDRVSAAVALSILIGDRTGLPDAYERRLQDAGTYHVIAISGGNIAILTAILVFITRLLRLPYRTAGVLTIVLLLFYGEIAGGSPSVSRAVAAAVVFLVATIVDHRGSPLNVIAIAATFGVIASPVAVFDAGFLLSFAATAGIILGVPRVLRLSDSVRCGLKPTAPIPPVGVLVATICAELAILPITASFFSRVTAAGLVVNFAAIPLMAVVQTASMVLLVVAPISATAADATATVVHLSAKGLLESSRFVELAPWMARDVPAPAWWLCATYYAAGAAMLIRATRPRVALLAGALGLIVIGPTVGSRNAILPPSHGILRVVVLDVGQGDATVIIPPDGDAIVVDAGGLAGTTFDIGGRVLIPAMRALGVKRVHAFVLTHADPDHIGGAEALVQRMPPANIWDGVPVPPHEARRRLVEIARQQRIIWRTIRPTDVEQSGPVELRVLHPPTPEWERQRVRNDDSVVLEVRYGNVSILLPGDIGREVEQALISSLQLGSTVILKAAHHGSATSSSEEFLEATRPAAAIFSAGKNNRFGHPARVVVERFQRRGVEMFNTADDGAVFVETDGRKVGVRGWATNRSFQTRAQGPHDDTRRGQDDTTTRRHDRN